MFLMHCHELYLCVLPPCGAYICNASLPLARPCMNARSPAHVLCCLRLDSVCCHVAEVISAQQRGAATVELGCAAAERGQPLCQRAGWGRVTLLLEVLAGAEPSGTVAQRAAQHAAGGVMVHAHTKQPGPTNPHLLWRTARSTPVPWHTARRTTVLLVFVCFVLFPALFPRLLRGP
eukprot:jgi/Ulvmu1/12425/UM009_0075.1